MFGELPKIFDKRFALNFFFPAFIYLLLTNLLFSNLTSKPFLPYLNGELLNDISLYVLIAYLGAVFLLIINRDLYRYFEGYGKYNPNKLFLWFEKRRYRKTIDEIEELDDEFRKCMNEKRKFPDASRFRRNLLMREIVERFPDQDSLLLPTSFGNTLRAFEIYSRVMYGFEYIDGWSRLLTIMPAEYRELVDNAKAEVDLWVNSRLLSFLMSIQLLYVWYVTRLPILLFLLGLTIIFHIVCLNKAQAYSLAWGDYAKSAFDVYRYNLLDAMQIPRPKSRNEERVTWTKFSQAVIYRMPDLLPEIKPLKAPIKKDTKR